MPKVRIISGEYFKNSDSRRGMGIFLFTTASRTALRLIWPPIQWVPGSLSLGVKRPGHEADHSPPSSAENHRGVRGQDGLTD
jgi:hypothetical protein